MYRKVQMTDRIYHHLFNSLNTPMLLTNASGTIIDANPAVISLFKEIKELIIGNTLENVLVGIVPEKTITDLVNENNQATEITLRHREPIKSFYINNTAPYEENGQILRFLIFTEKINSTELDNRIDDLQRDLQKEKQISIFGHLIPGIAHNINNPLAVIIGRSQLLSIKHPEIAGLDSIREQADQIKSIVDALSFKISHESLNKETPINIGELLRYELAVLNADPFYKHAIQKQIHLEHNTPQINGLYGDFSTALMTIINFSLDSMLSVEKKLFSVSIGTDSQSIIITIIDSGPIMATNNLDHVFSDSVTYQSSRLGQYIINLSRAEELISKYGGKISLRKNASDGKEFHIQIPCRNNSENS